MRRLPLLGLAAILGVALTAAPAPAASAYFETPSRNIACAWYSDSGGYLRCEIRSLLRPLPPRPAGCDVDWGYGLTLGRTGRASVLCAGDTIRRQGRIRILEYGSTWRRGGFRCSSSRTGLRCVNSSGHGFFLSRELWRRF